MSGYLLNIRNRAPVAIVRGEDGERYRDGVAGNAKLAAMAA